MKSSRPIDKVIEQASDELATLITRTRQLKRLTYILRRHLDEHLAKHCYIGNISAPTLTILVDGASWATKLRFATPDLLEKLSEENQVFNGLKQIKVKILTPTRESETTVTHHGPQMNLENAKGLQSLAESIEDPDLQRALNKLARHAKDS